MNEERKLRQEGQAQSGQEEKAEHVRDWPILDSLARRE
jgi:hypothetical protein